MPKRMVDLFVLDIIISIDRIKRYSKKLGNGEDLRNNETLCSAILRELGIIGEAMNQILQTKKSLIHSLTLLSSSAFSKNVKTRFLL